MARDIVIAGHLHVRGKIKLLSNPEIHTLLEQWNTFTADRENERHRLQNPPGVEAKKTELAELNRQMAELRGKANLLKAEIVLATSAEPYNKGLFDVQWTQKKTDLRERLEELFAEQISDGVSIPTIMSDYGMNNPVWLYKIKDKIKYEQAKAAAALKTLQWSYSDFTGTQRYALARGDDGQWTYAKIKGALGTEDEGQEAVFDFNTGAFISGAADVLNGVLVPERLKRANMLAAVLDGTYDGAWKASENPYFGGTQ